MSLSVTAGIGDDAKGKYGSSTKRYRSGKRAID